MRKLLTALGLIAFFGIWAIADNLTQYIPDWIGYLTLAAVAILPVGWLIKRYLWEN